MTFQVIVPNAGQSPGLFPAQNNTNFQRLQTIINADHIFNATAAANDGTHRQVTLTNRIDPTNVPAGCNSMLYGKTAVDSVNELWFYDNVSAKQLNWREIDGSVAIDNSSFATISAIPANCYGEVYLMSTTLTKLIVQLGVFQSNGTIVNGFSMSEKFVSGSGASQILRLGFNGDGESGLNLQVKSESSSTNDTYQYRIFYRHL